jgi:hypothetical protein
MGIIELDVMYMIRLRPMQQAGAHFECVILPHPTLHTHTSQRNYCYSLTFMWSLCVIR